MIFGRTIGVERRLLDWLKIEMPIMAKLDAETTSLAATLGCVENIRNGNTTLVENTFIPRRPDFVPEDAIFRAMKTVGIRGVVARAYHARNFAPEFIESKAEQDARVEALHAEWHGAEDGRLRLSIGPLLPWIVEIDDLRATRRLADRLGITIHMHVAESPEFNERITEAFGREIRNVELLHEGDCLGPDVQAVAVADLSDREIELLAETSTPVVFDPQTRLFWGTGFPGIKRFTDAGLTAGLGTNGPAANCGQDLFESMKYACATAKTAANDPTALGRHRVLEMATIEGARALGIDDRVGSLEVGKDADIITVDLAQPHLTPALDVPAALVYSAKGSDVRDAMVAGRLVMRKRVVSTVDQGTLLADCTAAARRLVGPAEAGSETRHVA
jgi:5-methylthioadenosine/S-adenosylhomocysteine deaminase